MLISVIRKQSVTEINLFFFVTNARLSTLIDVAGKARKGNEMTYETFMKKVDNIIAESLGGMTSGDLSDTVFTRDMFDEGCTPQEVAEEIMMGDDLARSFLEEFGGVDY